MFLRIINGHYLDRWHEAIRVLLLTKLSAPICFTEWASYSCQLRQSTKVMVAPDIFLRCLWKQNPVALLEPGRGRISNFSSINMLPEKWKVASVGVRVCMCVEIQNHFLTIVSHYTRCAVGTRKLKYVTTSEKKNVSTGLHIWMPQL